MSNIKFAQSKFLIGSLFSAATVVAAGSAQATDGMFSNGYGNAAKGMSGAGSVLSQDTQGAVNNPATMHGLGNRFDAGVSIFTPRRSSTIETGGGNTFFSTQGIGKNTSDSQWFLIPSAGVNFGYDNYSLGVTLTGSGGMNTDYDGCIFNNCDSSRTGIDLAQMMLAFTYARQLNDVWTIGISPTLAAQRFKADGLSPFANYSQDSTKLTGNGYDYSYGYGATFGVTAKPVKKLTLGATFKTRTYMTEFDKYKGLFAQDGDMDIPTAITLGMAYDARDDLVLAFDYKKIFYGGVRSIANTHNVNATDNDYTLGTKTGLGFGWQDMDIYKVGAQYDVDEALTVRGGFSYNTMAFAKNETMFNILAPAVPEFHLSGGMTYNLGEGHEIGAAVTHAFNKKHSNDSNINHRGNSVELQMNQYNVDVGYTYHF